MHPVPLPGLGPLGAHVLNGWPKSRPHTQDQLRMSAVLGGQTYAGGRCASPTSVAGTLALHSHEPASIPSNRLLPRKSDAKPRRKGQRKMESGLEGWDEQRESKAKVFRGRAGTSRDGGKSEGTGGVGGAAQETSED